MHYIMQSIRKRYGQQHYTEMLLISRTTRLYQSGCRIVYLTGCLSFISYTLPHNYIPTATFADILRLIIILQVQFLHICSVTQPSTDIVFPLISTATRHISFFSSFPASSVSVRLTRPRVLKAGSFLGIPRLKRRLSSIESNLTWIQYARTRRTTTSTMPGL